MALNLKKMKKRLNDNRPNDVTRLRYASNELFNKQQQKKRRLCVTNTFVVLANS